MQDALRAAILSTFIKLPFVIKIFVLSIFELPFYTSFTVDYILNLNILLAGNTVRRSNLLNIITQLNYILAPILNLSLSSKS